LTFQLPTTVAFKRHMSVYRLCFHLLLHWADRPFRNFSYSL